MIISMIAAMGPNREIGNDNKLLWHISEDLKNFKRITLDKPIVMGRKTFESIGRPLPKRENIVLSRSSLDLPDGVKVFKNKDEVLDYLKKENRDEVMIIGGGEVYKLFINDIDRLYLSLVDYRGPCDTYFPEFDHLNLKEVESKSLSATSDSPQWTFKVLEHRR